MKTLQINDTIPNLTFRTASGEHNFLDYRGKNIVLYFYPKDSTPGCTIESCNFRDEYPAFEHKNTVVLGVSRDSLASHEKFTSKHNFPFELISDPESSLCELFGVLKDKSLFGKQYKGIERSTFIINTDGKLTHAFRKIKIPGHVAAVLAIL